MIGAIRGTLQDGLGYTVGTVKSHERQMSEQKEVIGEIQSLVQTKE